MTDTDWERAAALRLIRADRIRRGGAPVAGDVSREVIATQQLAGIDARPHLRLVPQPLAKGRP